MVKEGLSYHERLRQLMDEYVHFVYDMTATFPSHERYGVISQFRRASLSIVLNYIEGFARFRPRVNKNFLETAFGSLKESEYLFDFSLKRGYCSSSDAEKGRNQSREIGAMLLGILRRL